MYPQRLQTYAVWALLIALASAGDEHHSKRKRQIFREQVLPLAGGKIPDGAFRSDRLALNRLNKEGIAIPDGVLLEARHRESHFGSHRHDPDIDAAIVKLVQRPDGRYAPPEGRYPFNNLVESTYIIRPPINTHGPLLPPQRVHQTVLRLPAKPFFNGEDDIFSFNHIENSPFDVLTTFGPDLSGTNIWTGFGRLYHDVPNRILRQTTNLPRRRQPVGGLQPNPPQQPAGPIFNNQQQNQPIITTKQPAVQLLISQPQKPNLLNGQGNPQLLKNLQPTPQVVLNPQQSTFKKPKVQVAPNSSQNLPGYPSLTTIPKTRFACSTTSQQMRPDPETSCQVFHLCHADGRKESFLCPQGSRFDASKNQCTSWKQVPCPIR